MADHLPDIALSIRQPWAWAIVNAGKDIENRSWATSFRGRVCIHASKGIGSLHDFYTARNFITDELLRRPPPEPKEIERGGIIGVAEIVACVGTHQSPWFFGPYGFVLRNARSVSFIPVKGALGFFDWRKRVEAADARG
ncbi:ASCH domain-containing protein [Cereibacter sphaeroides f. sp. denitrificans]|nr:ASCH domain-containing protein [Cereibacter sphaeroides f. sp. denitrificans]